MSRQAANEAGSETAEACDPVEMVIVPRERDIGGFSVRRVLPFAKRRMVGPFIFVDQMGPTVIPAGQGLDVRPHPHIGLATITYLFEGTIVHRDSLGTLQPITPGAVNWMTAGRGIVHSERSDPEIREGEEHVFGMQIWVALPEALEETDPAFSHTPAGSLPTIEGEGKRVRVIAGSLFGEMSPVETASPLVYAEASLEPGAVLPIDCGHAERAVYLLEGAAELAGTRFEPGRLLVLKPDVTPDLAALKACRVLLFGGEPLGPRHIWWNFVSSRKERIEQAKADWREGRFPGVPGETEFIPLPEGP